MSNGTTLEEYYDRFDRSKGWKKVLFRPSKVVQSAELNEIQSIQHSEFQQLGDALYGDGTILSGMDIIINGTDVTVAKGSIYALGFVHDILESQLTILGVGEELLGIKFTEAIITETDDSTLLDPAVQSRGYTKPGAHRLVYSYEFTVNDSSAIDLAIIYDGLLYKIFSTPIDNRIIDLLAERTFDESGSYKVEEYKIEVVGLSLADPNYDFKMKAILTGGKAYVKGYKVDNVVKSVFLDRPLSVSPRVDEPESYIFTQGNYLATSTSGGYDNGAYPVSVGASPEYETITVTFSDASNFTVSGSITGAMGSGDISTNFVSPQATIWSAGWGGTWAVGETLAFDTFGILAHNVDNTPVREVTGVTSIVKVFDIVMNRGGTGGGQDDIPQQYQPVEIVVTVHDFTGPGSTRKDYVQGIDFVHNGNYIDWSPLGDEPPGGGTFYLTLRYVRQMVKAKREKTLSSQTVVKGGVGPGTDALVQSDIYKVDSVKQGATTYVPGTDYTVDTATGAIVWEVGGTFPADATNYDVVFSYWDHAIEGDYIARDSFYKEDGTTIDFEAYEFNDFIYDSPSINSSFDVREQISFDCLGEKPDIGTITFYDYNYVLPRNDVLVVDTTGKISVIKGTPASNPVFPSIGTSTQMEIAKLHMGAEARADAVIVEYYDNLRLTMVNLRAILGEVKDIQYNQAVFQLANDANNIDTPTDKRGIFTDNFAVVSASDLSHPDYDATIDVLARTGQLPQIDEFHQMSSVTPLTKDNMWVLDYTEELFISQPFATDTIQCNPYTYVNLGALIALDPSHDEWTDTTRIDVREPEVVVRTRPRVLRNRVFLITHDDWLSQSQRDSGQFRLVPRSEWSDVANAQAAQGTTSRPEFWRQGNDIVGRSGVSNTTTTRRSVERVSTSVQVKLAEFARVIPISITGDRFIANEDNLTCMFNRTVVPLTSTGATVAGSNPGTVKADSDGKFTATVDVPEETSTGSHEIIIYGDSVGAGSRGESVFISEGYNRIVTRTTSVTTFQRTSVTIEDTSAVDPIAQTFTVADSTFLTKIGVFFKRKPTANNIPIDLIVVSVENGIPTQSILGEKTLLSGDITVSDDTSEETIFEFDHPVYVSDAREYAFILRADTSDYEVHISRVGDLDERLGWVNTNPNTGILLTSANMSTWTPEQNADITFNMYRANFSGTKEVQFDDISTTSPRSRFELKAAYSEPDTETVVDWKYSIDGGISWDDFTPPTEVDAGKSFDTLKIKAVLSTTNSRTSPVVYDANTASIYSWELAGAYVGRTLELFEQDCRYVELYMEEDLPPGCNIIPYVSLDSGGWQAMSHIPLDDRQLDQTWNSTHYQYDTGSDSTLHQDIKLKIEMDSPNSYTTPRVRKIKLIGTTI